MSITPQYLAESDSTSTAQPTDQFSIRDGLHIGTVAVVFVVAAYMLNHSSIKSNLMNLTHRSDALWKNDLNGWLLFVVTSCGLNAVGVPRVWISAIAGTFFGVWAGSALALLATLSGSSINFLIGRYFLQTSFRKFLPVRALAWIETFRQNGFRFTLYLRLFPFMNSTVANLTCGALHISYKEYISATLIGFLPLTIIFASLGNSAAGASHLKMFMGIAIFSVFILMQRVFNKLVSSTETQERF